MIRGAVLLWVVSLLYLSAQGQDTDQAPASDPVLTQDAAAPAEETITVCERESTDIDCGRNHINIRTAVYGRSDKTTCPHPDATDTSCRLDVATALGSLCNGQTQCRITASNNLAGDPCHGVNKYLKVSYTCEEEEPSASDLLSAFNRPDLSAQALEALERLIEQSLDLTGSLPPETCDGVKTAYHLASEDECLEDFNKQYRRLDGACNNLNNPNWGKANWPLKRLAEAVYYDSIQEQRRHANYPDETLPNPREVSVAVGTPAPVEGNDYTGSMILAILGQLIDHDLTHAPQFILECNVCPTNIDFSCSPIVISPKDALYKNESVCMDVPRTIGVPAHACSAGSDAGSPQREHLNSITSYLDGSFIYASDEEHLEKIRDHDRPSRLATYTFPKSEGLLPFLPLDKDHKECRGTLDGEYQCGLAGDERAAEQPTLTALHTIFVRMHNNIADELELLNSHWDQEKIFQEARKILVAIWQHVVYNEYLPALLGAPATHHYQLDIRPGREKVPAYDENLSATISNEFAAAAYRLGHSQIPVELERRDNDNYPLDAIPLIHAFFNASLIHVVENTMNGFVLGNINQRVNKIDRHFSSAIQGNLFFEEEHGFGLDLLAINIQRAREHGIPSYVVYHELCSPKQPKIETWNDLKGVFQDDELIEVLKGQYGINGVREIDLFIGLVLEKHLPGGRVGHTLGCMLGDQFKRLRLGDRFWFERDAPEGFSDSQLNAIKDVTLSRIICDTLDDGDNLLIQPYALHTPDCDTDKFKDSKTSDDCGMERNEKPWAQYSMENYFPEFETLKLPNFSNHRVSCSDLSQIPKLNLNPWIESTGSASEVDAIIAKESTPSDGNDVQAA